MRYQAVACDYDGTLAHHGSVSDAALIAVQRLRASGRRFLLVTGRELEDLQRVFPKLDVCDLVVAENGALLYDPATRRETVLAERPPAHLLQLLGERGVQPLSAGRVIVATREPHETTVVEVIRDLGLELQVIFNKGAVMVLPSGINKATGLRAALRELELPAEDVIAIGDAENDHAFFTACGFAVAVANALPALKAHAHWVTECANGAGVVELIERLLSGNLPGT